MKAIIAAFAFLYSLSILRAEGRPSLGLVSDLPPHTFTSVYEFKSWSGTSSFGGSRVGEIAIGERKFYWSDRMFTYGIATSEISIFVLRPSGELALVFYIPAQRGEFRLVERDGGIGIDKSAGGKNKWIEVVKIAAQELSGASRWGQAVNC